MEALTVPSGSLKMLFSRIQKRTAQGLPYTLTHAAPRPHTNMAQFSFFLPLFSSLPLPLFLSAMLKSQARWKCKSGAHRIYANK